MAQCRRSFPPATRAPPTSLSASPSSFIPVHLTHLSPFRPSPSLSPLRANFRPASLSPPLTGKARFGGRRAEASIRGQEDAEQTAIQPQQTNGEAAGELQFDKEIRPIVSNTERPKSSLEHAT